MEEEKGNNNDELTKEEVKKRKIILISLIVIIFIILLIVLYGYLQYLSNKKYESLEKELKDEEVASSEEDTSNKYIATDDNETYGSNNVTIHTPSGEAVYQVISGDVYTGEEEE